MSATKPPLQSLTVFLLKSGTGVEDALEEDEIRGLTRHELDASLPFKGALYLAPQRRAAPRWLDFLRQGTTDDLAPLVNASTSGILFIRSSKRILAFTFGYGKSLLRPSRIERGFGLRVVLNTVDTAGLRSIDTRTIQELTVHTRRQTSRLSRLADFEVDREEDLVGAIAGVPRDPSFARVVNGADALQFRAALEFRDLGDKCKEILTEFRSDAYKNRGFEFVDYVKKVLDPELIEQLDSELLAALGGDEHGGFHLAPPEIIDWEAIEGFGFTPSASPEPDLSLDSFFAQIRRADEVTIRRLKSQRVFVHVTDAGSPVKGWPIYRALVAELDLDEHRYVLSGGDWHEIDPEFATRIENQVNSMRLAGLDLPKARPGEEEKAYNARVAGRGVHNMDRKCVRVDGDQVELCDLYVSVDRQFVHVKRWTSSSTLSHLFAQGRISAETLLSDEMFRESARKVLGEAASSLAAHIPTGRPDPSNYRVVFAIIKGGQGWKKSLPFFSKLNLVREAKALRTLGFDVRLERIDVE